MEWLLEKIREIKPDQVVCLGDLVEADSASRWEKEDAPDLDVEFTAASSLLSQVRITAETNHGNKFVLLEGNHDDNLRRKGRLPKSVRSMCLPEAHILLSNELRHWTVFPYENSERGVYRLGRVAFTHGFAHGVGSDREEAVLFSGAEDSLVVRAHTHQPERPTQVFLTKKIPLPYWYANAGTLRDLKPEWTSRLNTRRWAHALVVVEVAKNGDWKAETLFR